MESIVLCSPLFINTWPCLWTNGLSINTWSTYVETGAYVRMHVFPCNHKTTSADATKLRGPIFAAITTIKISEHLDQYECGHVVLYGPLPLKHRSRSDKAPQILVVQAFAWLDCRLRVTKAIVPIAASRAWPFGQAGFESSKTSSKLVNHGQLFILLLILCTLYANSVRTCSPTAKHCTPKQVMPWVLVLGGLAW